MKQTKSVISLMLVLALLMSFMPVISVSAEESSSSISVNSQVLEATTGGYTMDLTAAGTTDWMHVAGEINQKLGEGDGQILDLVSSTTSGWGFGNKNDAPYRYQVFTAPVDGEAEIGVALNGVSDSADLVAMLYKITDGSTTPNGENTELVSQIEVDRTTLTAGAVNALPFEDVELAEGQNYVLVLGTTDAEATSDLYGFGKGNTDKSLGGKIKADGTWQTDVSCGIRVTVGERIPVDIIEFEVIGDAVKNSTFGDSRAGYTWTDGTITPTKSGYTTGAVVNYFGGEDEYTNVEIEGEHGYKISIPADNSIQTLSFVAGTWNGEFDLDLYADGELEQTISVTDADYDQYSNVTTLYTLTVQPNVDVEVVVRYTYKNHSYGNVTIGGIALNRQALPEEAPMVSVDVSGASGTMDLTEVGTTDWVHFTSEQVNRKGDADDLAAYQEWEASWADSAEIIDYMSTTGTSGRTFGQTSDQVWRFQTFASSVSGPLTSVEVALIKKGSPSNLIAKLFKVTDASALTVEEVASTTVAADDITSNAVLALDFGEVEIEADTYYAVALTQETLDSSNLYHWCNSSNSMPNGKVTDAEGTQWVLENTAAALRVQVGEIPEAPAINAADIIQFQTTGEASMGSTMSDSAVAYSWSDGVPTMTASGSKKGGVISYNNGVLDETVPEGTGWKITIPEDDSIQTLTFVSGVWQSSGEIYIMANGEEVYSNTELTAGSTSVLKTYTVTVSPNVEVEIYYQITAEGHAWGNSSLGGVTLSRTAADDSTDYIGMLENAVQTAQLWASLDGIEEYYADQLNSAVANAQAALAKGSALSNTEAYTHYIILNNAITAAKNSYASGNFANSYASGMCLSFGWEGDKNAPIEWIDGTYRLRDNGDKYITFGVTGLEANSVSWYNAEGYLPCFVHEYDKDTLSIKIENFADEVYVNGNRYEIAYSRMTVTNNGESVALLPMVSDSLVALNDAAASAEFIQPGETIVRDYCIGADRFGAAYAYPSDEDLAAQGSWDEHYEHMKSYWNERLENIVDISNLPDDYETLINAYKAGYIYMLIISDGYELHVGENGYDRVFDHDVIGMLASLILSGHTENFSDYAKYILQNVQYSPF